MAADNKRTVLQPWLAALLLPGGQLWVNADQGPLDFTFETSNDRTSLKAGLRLELPLTTGCNFAVGRSRAPRPLNFGALQLRPKGFARQSRTHPGVFSHGFSFEHGVKAGGAIALGRGLALGGKLAIVGDAHHAIYWTGARQSLAWNEVRAGGKVEVLCWQDPEPAPALAPGCAWGICTAARAQEQRQEPGAVSSASSVLPRERFALGLRLAATAATISTGDEVNTSQSEVYAKFRVADGTQVKAFLSGETGLGFAVKYAF